MLHAYAPCRKRALLESMRENTIHMAMGTHGIEVTRRLIASHRAATQIFVVSAVLGRPDLAAAGKLSIIPAGPADTIDKLRPRIGRCPVQTFFAIGCSAPAAWNSL